MSGLIPRRLLRADVLIVVSEAECSTAVIDALPSLEENELDSGTIVWTGGFDTALHGAVQIALLNANADNAGALTQEALGAIRPNYAIYLGIAASIAGDLRVGDVAIATPLYCIDGGEEGKDFRPQPRGTRAAHRLEQRSIAEANRFEWRRFGTRIPDGEDGPYARLAPVASSRVVFQRGAEGLAWLRQNYSDTMAVIRSGEDFVTACGVSRTEMIVLGGVSHDLRGSAPATPTMRRAASRALVGFSLCLIAKVGPLSPSSPHSMDPEPPINALDEHRARLSHRLRELLHQRQIALRDANRGQIERLDQELRDVRGQLRTGPHLAKGDLLGDRYLLAEQIGSGGFATVFRAYDIIERRDVAVKVLHPNLGEREEIRERFFRGARRMAELVGSGAVRVTDFRGSDRGFHYFAMELLQGHLRAAVTASRAPLRERLEWICQVGQTLGAAHRLGIVHRDVRPENVLVDTRQRAHLSDFDTAHIPDGTRFTEAAIGTYVYAAPEQLQNAQPISAQADIYSLALVALFVITGSDPDSAALQRDRNGLIEKLPIPPELKLILARALAFHPRDRHYVDAHDFCEDLALCLRSWTAAAYASEPRLRLARLAQLCGLHAGEFEHVVAQVERDSLRRCPRDEDRVLCAINTLRAIENYGVNVSLRPVRGVRSPEDIGGAYPATEWEEIYAWLCGLPHSVLHAFAYTHGFDDVINPVWPMADQADAVVCSAAREQDEYQFVDVLRGFSHYFDTVTTPPASNAVLVRLGWVHRKLELALALLRQHRGAEHQNEPDELSLALEARDYEGLKRMLGDIYRWKSAPLVLSRWVGRARILAAEALDLKNEAQSGAAAPLSKSPLTLYRALCRMGSGDWLQLRSALVSPCLLSVYQSRSRQAMEMIESLSSLNLGVLDQMLDENVALLAPVSTNFSPSSQPYRGVQLLPHILCEELIFRVAPEAWRKSTRFWSRVQFQERWCALDPAGMNYSALLQEFEHEMRSVEGEVPFGGVDVSGGGEISLRLWNSCLSDPFLVWEALDVPSWYWPAEDAPRAYVTDELVSFICWLFPTSWPQAVLVADGDLKRLVRWIGDRRETGLRD